MSGHTPGPWMVDDETRNHGPLVIERNGKLEIAAVYGDSREQRAANARLIATAPDLLEACKSYIARLDTLGGKKLTNVIAQIREAIAKAEGKL